MGCVDGPQTIALVETPEAIIPALVSFYRSNPPRWEREGPAKYTKFTDFGVLRVERIEGLGEWTAFREGFPLMHHGRAAWFASKQEAQWMADIHKAEGFPNSRFVLDGFAWQPDPDPWWIYDRRIAQLRPKTVGTLHVLRKVS
jgi:hypothetical protein